MPLYYEYKGEINHQCEHPNFPGGRRWKVGSVWQCRDCKRLWFIVAKNEKHNAMWYLIPKEITPPIPQDAEHIWQNWIKDMLDQWEKEGCPIYSKDLDENVPTPGYEVDVPQELLDSIAPPEKFLYLSKTSTGMAWKCPECDCYVSTYPNNYETGVCHTCKRHFRFPPKEVQVDDSN